jgi:hypothetical protein
VVEGEFFGFVFGFVDIGEVRLHNAVCECYICAVDNTEN